MKRNFKKFTVFHQQYVKQPFSSNCHFLFLTLFAVVFGLGGHEASAQLAYAGNMPTETSDDVHASVNKKAMINGKVIKSNGEPAAFVAVGIKNSMKSGLTNEEGFFKIKGIQPGTITLRVSGAGIVPQEKQVVLDAGASKSLTFRVRDTTKHLKTVTISYSRNKFATKESDFVAKMPLANLENPQAYTVIPKTLMKEQMVVNYNDAFKNIPGTEIPSVANNGRMDISSRGFKVRSQIIDGVSGYTMTNIDPANIENIEVVRGPSATLYGSSLTSYGGLVNIVTKQPYDHFGGNVSYYLGSFGTNRLTADVNTPLNKKRNLLFRINAAGQTEKSFQDAGFNRSLFAAPSLSFTPNSRISLSANMEYYFRRATSPYWFVPYKKTNITDVSDLGLDKERSFINNDMYYNARQINARFKAELKISDAWISTTLFSATTNNLDGLMISLAGISDSSLVHSVSDGPQHFATLELQQNFLNDKRFGKFRNRFLAGLDFYQYKSNSTTTTVKMDTVNFIHPGTDYQTFTKNKVNEALTEAEYKNTMATQNTYSAYLSDVFSFNQRWFLMAGLRLDRFENKGAYDAASETIKGGYGQTAFSPKVGLVYQPVPKKMSVYANFMNGFENVNGTDYEGNTFKPQQANQWEAGVKLAMWKGRLTTTLSAYRILVDDILRTDMAHAEYSVQDGTELSKGIELSATLNPVTGLNIIGGYAYNYCVYQKADDGLEGLRPDGAGPQQTADLWLSYKLHSGLLNGLGLGAGGRYGSRLTAIKSFSREFNVPEYTILDATIYYERRFYRIGLKVNNLTHETYWNNRLEWQAPRSITAGVTLKF